GVHSAVAYLGALAGRETIAEALRMPGLVDLLRHLIARDIAPSFTPPAGVSVVDYGESVLERFANPAIGHRTLQVAMDGSQKLPQRTVPVLLDRRAAGAEPRWAALVAAAWARFPRGQADDGRPLPLDAPLAPAIRSALAAAPDTPEGVADALLGLRAVFPPEFAEDDVLRRLIVEWLAALSAHGVEKTLAAAAR